MNVLTDHILSAITFLPLVGAFVLLFVGGEGENGKNLSRWIALVTSLVTFALSLWMWSRFDPANAGFQFVENYEWIGSSIGYRMGVDGVSILFVVLTALLLPACILSSWGSVQNRVREYMIVFLILETMCIGVFTTLDLAMFYVFFEGSLIPMFLIIGIWGGARRIQAAYKFFFYSFTGTVLMLLAIMAMYWQAGTLDIRRLLEFNFDPQLQTWLWLGFFASFAVKMPMWPFHRWLPEAHVEAPTAGSVILAAILLKLGGYGFIRFSLDMFPNASELFAPFVFTLSIAAIIITSLVALVQTDVKKLIAYSSVAHMGFVTMGIFSGNIMGIHGAVFQMISHGIVSGALFLCVGVVYDRMHTREISAYGGLVERMPRYAFAFMVFTMANVGLPGTSGFIGEFLTMIGVFPGQHLGRVLCRVRRHPLGGLCALALPPGDLRRAHQGIAQGHPRSRPPRNRGPGSADRAHDPLRLLSRPHPRRDRRIGEPRGGKLQQGDWGCGSARRFGALGEF